MTKICISQLNNTSIEDEEKEIVERKGLGHPDTICDSIADKISIELSKAYIQKFGRVLHHNTDKSLLVAGKVGNRFGGGVIIEPMELVIGDRATSSVGNVIIPIHEIAESAARDWLGKNISHLDPVRDVKYRSVLKSGSAALTGIFETGEEILGANDTSAAVGYAPLSRTEKAVLEGERFLNGCDFKKKFPETGQDVKIMGVRRKNELELTIAMNFVDRYIDSVSTYFRRKEEVLIELQKHMGALFDFSGISYNFNMADRKDRSIDGLYVTVTGTCADGADCGQVGRGNRVNGVIPLNRPTCSEAAAGKNPVSHIGKIYNLLTFRIADKIYSEVPESQEVYVWLVSQIARPINEPCVASVKIIPKKGYSIDPVKGRVREIFEHELDKDNLKRYCMDSALGKISVC